MAGAASTLLEHPADAGSHQGRELLQTIVEESARMSRLIENLLDMSRLESGAIAPNRQWQVLEEIVGSALARLQRELAGRTIHTDIPVDLPLLSVDGLLIEQVLINALENAVRYTPPGSPIEIAARAVGDQVELSIADHGPGLPAGAEARVFDKFYRGATVPPDARRGVGLGLAICRGMVEAHGGRITARNRAEGGAEFLIALPSGGVAPRFQPDNALVPAGA
jgi:two-component system sensor histidine kinase KdpD